MALMNKQKLALAAGIIIVVAIAFLAWHFLSHPKVIGADGVAAETSCFQREDFKDVDPQILGLLPEGKKFYLLKNYYACNAMRRGEIVAVQLDEKTRLSRIVRATPGDTIEAIPAPQEKGFILRVNLETLMDSTLKKPQIFGAGYLKAPEGVKDPLHPYFRKGQMVLPPEEFMVFSYVSPSSKDSSEFGPVKAAQILGRIIIE